MSELVSASGLLIFCFQQTHLSSPSLSTGRQAQEGVSDANLIIHFRHFRQFSHFSHSVVFFSLFFQLIQNI